MTLSELQTLCSVWLDDVNFGYFTQTILKNFLNNSQREVQKRLLQAGQDFYVKRYQTTLVASSPQYTLPENFLKMHKAEVVTSGAGTVNESTQTLGYVTRQEADLIPPGTGVPGYYTLQKNILTLFPAPDSTYVCRIAYSPLVADMVNAGDTPDVPTQYQELIAILTTIDCLLRDGRDATQFIAKREYYENLMKQDAQNRTEDASRRVRTTDSEGYELF